ncbi:hypothetical protein BOTBODRAFT_157174 [Botryobasidium botryosum FD-172 SS1]|uniref:EF-hand domain-containing protein n=1 Tax=Botryobasidium botryosum (strain FD-172 SS1) TaxID=930990 RepID=A0A067MLE6_BOTB1|nr:hypothetical protein BOTBODRAFT_157174 [Botryobasidium botryosum FD-172 SS1]
MYRHSSSASRYSTHSAHSNYNPGGGFVTQGIRQPPPGADPTLWRWFIAVDTDGSNAISPEELQRALVNGNMTPFDIDTCKMLMNIFDTDRSGTIGFNEFVGLWQYIREWQNVFRHFDRDNSGTIDGHELSAALHQFGYNLSPALLSLVEHKYGTIAPATAYGPQSTGITFDRFVRACVVIKQLTEDFRRMDTDRDGWIQISYDQFMTSVLRAP